MKKLSFLFQFLIALLITLTIASCTKESNITNQVPAQNINYTEHFNQLEASNQTAVSSEALEALADKMLTNEPNGAKLVAIMEDYASLIDSDLSKLHSILRSKNYELQLSTFDDTEKLTAFYNFVDQVFNEMDAQAMSRYNKTYYRLPAVEKRQLAEEYRVMDQISNLIEDDLRGSYMDVWGCYQMNCGTTNFPRTFTFAPADQAPATFDVTTHLCSRTVANGECKNRFGFQLSIPAANINHWGTFNPDVALAIVFGEGTFGAIPGKNVVKSTNNQRVDLVIGVGAILQFFAYGNYYPARTIRDNMVVIP